jgi:hypothetical protein
MQVTAKPKISQFIPVSLEIVLESQEELDCLAQLFNFTPVCDALAGILRTTDIRDQLVAAGARQSRVEWLRVAVRNHAAIR